MVGLMVGLEVKKLHGAKRSLNQYLVLTCVRYRIQQYYYSMYTRCTACSNTNSRRIHFKPTGRVVPQWPIQHGVQFIILGHHDLLDRDVRIAKIAFHLHQGHIVRHVQKSNGPLRFIQLNTEHREKWRKISVELYRVKYLLACMSYPPVLGHSDRVVVSRRLRVVSF
jgi:hypothetical protein